MRLRLLPALAACVGLAFAAPKWTEVQSPHFDVVSDGGAGAARHVAGQLERLRAVFHAMFPGLKLGAAETSVLAVKTQDEFQKLIPIRYVGGGRVKFAGYYQSDPDRNFILLSLEANQGNDDFPYESIYGAYALSLTAGNPRMPLWLAQGLSSFYGTARIDSKSVSVGLMDPGRLGELRGSFHLLPLATLLGVTQTSPYFELEGKSEPFFSECWLLTHFLIMQDRRTRRHQLQDYVDAVDHGGDAVEAARQAFGDLDKLQTQLEQYLRHQAFPFARYDVATVSDDKSLPAATISGTQAEAAQAAFLAHEGRWQDGAKLAQAVVAADPRNVSGYETLGYAAFRQNDFTTAVARYAQAVELGSTDFAAQYRFAALEMRAGPAALDAATAAKAVAALQAAIRLNPGFAPAYDRLAVLHWQRHEQIAAAEQLEREAIALAPTEAAYRLNRAGMLMDQRQFDQAATVLRAARPLAQSEQEREQCDSMLQNIAQYQDALAAQAERAAAARASPDQAAADTSAKASAPPTIAPAVERQVAEATREPKLAGARRVLRGTITGVRCGWHRETGAPATFTLALDLAGQDGTTTLQSADYLKVPFRATNFTPRGVLNPCDGLKGLHAVITAAGDQIVRVDLSR